MKRSLILLSALLLAASAAWSAERPKPAVSQGTLCSRHLLEGDRYRTNERYELARQSYAQALSLCEGKRVAQARKGLDTVEMLLRTMR